MRKMFLIIINLEMEFLSIKGNKKKRGMGIWVLVRVIKMIGYVI